MLERRDDPRIRLSLCQPRGQQHRLAAGETASQLHVDEAQLPFEDDGRLDGRTAPWPLADLARAASLIMVLGGYWQDGGEMQPDLRVRLSDGTVVGYAEAGDPEGPPVMYLHGSPSSRLEVGLPGIREAAEDLGLRVVAPDRPGMGLSTFRRFSIVDYPGLVRSFADALGLGRFAVAGVSGGGKYACACAWALAGRATRVALVSSTCSFDLPGARATWNAEDRRLYGIAGRAPWLVRLLLAKVARDLRRDPGALFSTVERSVGAADKDVLTSQGFREALERDMGEAFRQGGRGPAHDLTLEARPWGVPFERIEVPIEIWHGQDDRVVSAQQSRILAGMLPLVTEHYVPGEGHFSLFAKHAVEVLDSLASS